MNSQLVSIIIPTYKRTVNRLSNAVSSVLNQTYDNIEIIIVDDNPPGYEHQKELSEYISSLDSKNIIYIKNEVNLGGSLSRNKGIEKAKGEFITFLDDDDEYLSQKIEKQVKFMNEKGCDLSFSDMTMYNEDGKVVDYRCYTEIPAFDKTSLLRYHLLHHMTGTPTFMFKAEKLREIGGFDKAPCGQEFRLMLKAIEHDLKISYMHECDVKILRGAEGGISFSMDKIRGEKELFKIKSKYFDILTAEEIRYIKFRYHAVMAISYKRNSIYNKMIIEGITAVLTSPKSFVTEVVSFKKKLKETQQ